LFLIFAKFNSSIKNPSHNRQLSSVGKLEASAVRIIEIQLQHNPSKKKYKMLVRKHHEKRSFERSSCRWEGNTEMNVHTVVRCELD
jgi:hypothetical protein